MKTQTLPMRLEDMIEDAAGIGACFKSPISQQKGVRMFLGLLLLAYFHQQSAHTNITLQQGSQGT